jgi:hypothetical protein
MYRKLRAYCLGDMDLQRRLVGQECVELCIRNPFLPVDERRVAFDREGTCCYFFYPQVLLTSLTARRLIASYRNVRVEALPPTINKLVIFFGMKNKHWADPDSVKCLRTYCTCTCLTSQFFLASH